MKRQKLFRRVVSMVLLLAVVCTTWLDGVTIAKAAEGDVGFRHIREQNAIQLTFAGGSSINYDQTLTFVDTGGSTTITAGSTAISNEMLLSNNLREVAYCLEFNVTTPSASGTAFQPAGLLNDLVGIGYESLSGSATFTQEQHDKMRAILKWGYPANKDYWARNGVADEFVQAMVTQMALWTVLEELDNSGRISNTLVADKSTLPAGSEYFSVNTAMYPNSFNGDIMLRELITIGKNETYVPGGKDPDVIVSSNSASAQYHGGKYVYSYTVKYQGAFRGVVLSAEGLPSDYAMQISGVAGDVYFGADGMFPINTPGIEGEMTVSIRTSTPSTITLKANVPKANVDQSVFFNPVNWQSVLWSRVEYDGATGNSPMATVEDVCLEIYKTESINNGPMPNVVFGVYSDSAFTNRVGSITTDTNGYGSLEGLAKGNYYLKEEVVPDANYSGGWSGNTEGMTANITNGQNGITHTYTFNVENQAKDFELKVEKTDSITVDKKLPGAKFQVFADEACTVPLTGVQTTGADGTTTFSMQLVANRDVWIKEIAAPTGYVRADAPKKFTFGTAESNNTEIENDLQKGKIEVSKLGEVLVGYSNGQFVYENRAVSGVIFGVYSDSACTNLVTQLTTGADGKAVTGELDLGTYYVKELIANANGLLNKEVKEVTLVYAGDTVAVTNASVSVMNDKRDVYAAVLKQDGTTKQPLAGAQFTLYANENIYDYLGNLLINRDAVLGTVTTGADGKATFNVVLPVGYGYYIKETKAPTNYLVNGSTFNFTEVWDQDASSSVTHTYTCDNDEQKGRIEVYKKGEVLTGFTNGRFVYTEEFVSGVQFGIYSDSACTNLIETITTDASGYAASSELGLGTYYVREISANENCLLNKTVYTVSLLYDANSSIVVKRVDVTNDKQDILANVVKLDKDKMVPLAGAQFTLYANENIYDYLGNILVPAGTRLEVITTGADGKAAFANVLPVGYSFYVVESKAPTNYLPTNEKFNISEPWDQNAGASITKTYTCYNNEQKGKIEVYKKGEVLTGFTNGRFVYTEEFVSGAKFGIYTDSACTNLIETITTNASGYAASSELDLGTYYVKEIAANVNCLLNTKVEKVELTYDVSIQTIVSSVNVTNTKRDVFADVLKLDKDTLVPLEGAQFTLYAGENIYDYLGNLLINKDAVLGTVTTGANGKATFNIELPVGYNYYIKETKAPTDYNLNDSKYEFTESWAENASGNVTHTYICYNEAQRGKIEVYKKGEVLTGFANGKFIYTEEFVAGVQFGIYTDSACTNLIETITTDANGYVQSGELDLGTYYIKELKANTNGLLNKEVKVVELKHDATKTVIVESVDFVNDKRDVYADVLKQDNDTKEPLSGAQFTLYAGEDILDYKGNLLVKKDTVLGVVTTGADGKATFNVVLPVGYSYYIKETKAPTNYNINNNKYEFTESWIENVSGSVTHTYICDNEEQRGKIEVYKKGEVLTGFADGKFIYTEEFVSGADFGIYSDKECKTLLEKITTGKDGKAVSKELKLGTYYVKELVAPIGCVLDETVHEVKLVYDGASEEIIISSVGLTNKRQRLLLDIVKVDGQTKESISGVKFALYAGEDIADYKGNVLVKKDTLLETVVSDKDGKLLFTLDLPHGKYVVKEVEPAPGYIDGNVVREYDLSYKADAGELIVVKDSISNDKTNILIAKKDKTGIKEQLAGATISLRDVNDPTKVIYSFVTGEKPEELHGVPVGKYILREDKAPWGFEIAEDQIIEIKDTTQMQYFEIVDEAKLGELSFSYDDSGDWFRAPNVGADTPDIPATGDSTNIMLYIWMLVGSLVALLGTKLDRKKLAKLICGLGVVLAAFGFGGKVVSADEVETETKSVEYTSETKDKKYDFDTEIEIDGVKYNLTHVNYDVKEEDVIEDVLKENKKESDTIYRDGVDINSMFERDVVIDGKTYTLNKVEKVELPAITNRTEKIAENVVYLGYVSLDADKSTMVAKRFDPLLGVVKESTLKMSKVTVDKTYWSDDFSFEIKLVINGPYFKLGDNVLVYNADKPGFEGYEDYFLGNLGLDKEAYKINSYSWKGEAVTDANGVMYRIAVANGSRKLNDYTVSYDGDIVFDDIAKPYKAVATYTRQEAQATGKVRYNIKATAEYTKAAPEPQVAEPDEEDDNTLIIGISIVIAIIILLLLLFILLRRKKKKDKEKGNKANTYTRDDERRTF